MVAHTEGQFYTMEGIAAAILMVLTAYLVMGATTVYTPGDTHIIDMQLEQIGNDALKMMDTKNYSAEPISELERYVSQNKPNEFNLAFNESINNLSLLAGFSGLSNIHFKSFIYYVNSTGEIPAPIEFSESYYSIPGSQKFSGNENTVRASRWVFVKKDSFKFAPDYATDERNQTVLLEVLLWRG
jgi:hypothetical protein